MSSTVTDPNVNYNDSISSSIQMEFDQGQNAYFYSFPIIAAIPLRTSITDTVKLDAMVSIEILTSGNGELASYYARLEIERQTYITVPGSSPSTTTTLISTEILDANLNNPPSRTPLTRIVNLSWIDTPPSGTSIYRLKVANETLLNIYGVSYYSNRSFSALVLHKN